MYIGTVWLDTGQFNFNIGDELCDFRLRDRGTLFDRDTGRTLSMVILPKRVAKGNLMMKSFEYYHKHTN